MKGVNKYLVTFADRVGNSQGGFEAEFIVENQEYYFYGCHICSIFKSRINVLQKNYRIQLKKE